jgi:hypothetical protein
MFVLPCLYANRPDFDFLLLSPFSDCWTCWETVSILHVKSKCVLFYEYTLCKSVLVGVRLTCFGWRYLHFTLCLSLGTAGASEFVWQRMSTSKPFSTTSAHPCAFDAYGWHASKAEIRRGVRFLLNWTFSIVNPAGMPKAFFHALHPDLPLSSLVSV